jgi:hypothetical protein
MSTWRAEDMVNCIYRGPKGGKEITPKSFKEKSPEWTCYKINTGYIVRDILGLKDLKIIKFGFIEHQGKIRMARTTSGIRKKMYLYPSDVVCGIDSVETYQPQRAQGQNLGRVTFKVQVGEKIERFANIFDNNIDWQNDHQTLHKLIEKAKESGAVVQSFWPK